MRRSYSQDILLSSESQTALRNLHGYFRGLIKKITHRPTKAETTARMLGDLVARMPGLTFEERETELGCRLLPYFDYIRGLWEEARTLAGLEEARADRRLSRIFMLQVELAQVEKEIYLAFNAPGEAAAPVVAIQKGAKR